MKDFFSSPAAVQLEAGNGAISSPENWSSLTAALTDQRFTLTGRALRNGIGVDQNKAKTLVKYWSISMNHIFLTSLEKNQIKNKEVIIQGGRRERFSIIDRGVKSALQLTGATANEDQMRGKG